MFTNKSVSGRPAASKINHIGRILVATSKKNNKRQPLRHSRSPRPQEASHSLLPPPSPLTASTNHTIAQGAHSTWAGAVAKHVLGAAVLALPRP